MPSNPQHPPFPAPLAPAPHLVREPSITVRDLVLRLTELEDEHLDHGRRLQAAGVRSAIERVQAFANTVDGTSAGVVGRRDPAQHTVS